VKPETLYLLTELRALIASEPPVKLHGAQPAPDTKHGEQSYGHMTGLPWTAGMNRYMGHYDGWGETRQGTRSILEVDRWCRQRHRSHSRGDRRPLCAYLLMLTAYWRNDLPDPDLEPILLSALRHARAYRVGAGRPRLDEPLPYSKLQNAPARKVQRARRVRTR
jgi:hypothetical protein